MSLIVSNKWKGSKLVDLLTAAAGTTGSSKNDGKFSKIRFGEIGADFILSACGAAFVYFDHGTVLDKNISIRNLAQQFRHLFVVVDVSSVSSNSFVAIQKAVPLAVSVMATCGDIGLCSLMQDVSQSLTTERMKAAHAYLEDAANQVFTTANILSRVSKAFSIDPDEGVTLLECVGSMKGLAELDADVILRTTPLSTRSAYVVGELFQNRQYKPDALW